MNLVAGASRLDDPLQLIGDGLLAALAQDVAGAAALAADCARALRERGWPGDGDLAHHLEAALGAAAAPMLRPLPVDLDELAATLEGDVLQRSGRIDLLTGEVWSGPAIEYADTVGEEDAAAHARDPDRWLWVHSEGSRDRYRDMEEFIGTVSDAVRSDRLEMDIGGPNAFQQFEDVLSQWPAELERWHAFSEDRRRGRARAWLAAAGYCLSPPARPRIEL